MSRPLWIVLAVLIVVGLGAGSTAYVLHKRASDAAAAQEAKRAAARAQAYEKYQRLSAIQSRADAALKELGQLESDYDAKYNDAATASQRRHDLAQSAPYDVSGGLAYITQEKAGVEPLEDMTSAKAKAARGAAAAFADAYGDSATSGLLSDITAAAEFESEGISDWSRAASALYDAFSARANGRFSIVSDDVAGLYKSSDDAAARSRELWDSAHDRLLQLRTRLERDVSSTYAASGAHDTYVPTATTAPLFGT